MRSPETAPSSLKVSDHFSVIVVSRIGVGNSGKSWRRPTPPSPRLLLLLVVVQASLGTRITAGSLIRSHSTAVSVAVALFSLVAS